MAQMPVASLMFQKHFVRPAEKLVKVGYDEPRTYDSLKEKRWDRIGFHLDGDLSPLLPLVHRFRVERFDAPRTTRVADLDFTPPEGRIASDTGELVWEAREKGAGRLSIDAPRVQAAVGWVGGKTVATADAEFRLKTPFCAVSLIALDSQPLTASKKILLVAAARCANTGMKWNAERTSINDNWGGPPLLVEAVEGEISLRRSPNAPELILTRLDGRGLPQAGSSTALTKQQERRLLSLGRDDATVWYALEP
jgi:hypothetical protein